ncbi:MAG TPA: AIR synthase related protein, partial [Actinomycetota bacterium]|nr:AIR synthase related protein [Actinomycetota bacterium]
AVFLRMLGSPAIASKRWVWEQYDHMIFLGTIEGPGGDAAVIRLPDTDVAVAISTDGPGRYCYLDPYEGAKLAVAESARNVACTGARPLAVTNCLNFGNPEKPDVMWQFAEAVRGIGDACTALETPVTGGNVSFYNETQGRAIYPTPVIGMLGVLLEPTHAVGSAFARPGDAIVLIGTTDPDDFGGSEYAKLVHDTVAGAPPKLDLVREKRVVDLLVTLAADGIVSSAHDPSGGGIAMALAEAAIRGGNGFDVQVPADSEAHRWLFSESPSRAVVTCAAHDVEELLERIERGGLEGAVLGSVGGDALDLGVLSIPLEDAKRTFEEALPLSLSATTMAP